MLTLLSFSGFEPRRLWQTPWGVYVCIRRWMVLRLSYYALHVLRMRDCAEYSASFRS